MIRLISSLAQICLFFLLFSLTPGTAFAAQLTLTWTDTALNEDGFKIERRDGAATTFTQISTVPANTSSYIDATVIGGATYCYQVRAYNTAGNSAYAGPACRTVSADTQAPAISITAPANGSMVSSSAVTVSALASDNVGVVGVQFLLDGNSLDSEDTSAPYSISWNTTTVANGSHTLTARARDAAGNTAMSTAVSVTVSNTAPPPPNSSGLVAAYSLNANSGTTVTDESGQGNIGTISGAAWTTSGKFGAALAFDGVDDRVIIPDSASLDLTSAGTLEAWVKLDTLGRWHSVIAKGNANKNNAHNYALEITSANVATCILSNGAATFRLDSSIILIAGQFYHLACAWNGTTVSLYVNGALNRSTAQTLTPAGNTASLFLGQFGGNADPLDGVLDNVRIYNRTLSATEIQTDVNTPGGTSALTVTRTGAGGGSVTSSPAGINCDADCTESYLSGTVVTLTATPASGSTFAGWGGDADCSDGSVTMTTAKTCIATFTLQTFTLTVTKSGAGGGTITSSPLGISCGSDCAEPYATNTVVTLTATPASDSTFTGWSGSCTSTDTCSVTMSASKSVTAAFTLKTTTSSLTVIKAGDGSGTVTSSPLGISCGSDCAEPYATNTVVTLSATPAFGSTFAGWSGSCTGTGACSVTMSASKSVTATFTTGLVATYGFDAGSGTTATDASGNNNTGTLVGGVTWTTTGKYGAALSLDGVDDHVSIPDSASLDLGSQGTVLAWVKLGAVNTWRGVVAKGNANKNASHNYFLEVRKDNYILAGVGNGSSSNTVVSPSALTDTAAYHHLAFTWSGNSLNLYLDGVLIRTGSQTVIPTANAAPLFIGQFGGNADRFKGIIDEVHIYNRALSLSEIQTAMTTPVATATTTAQVEATASMLNVQIGVYRPSTGKVYWDKNGNGRLDDCQTDSCTIAADPSGSQTSQAPAKLNTFALPGDQQITGDWLGTGQARVGTFDPHTGIWELDLNDNGVFDGCMVDACLGPFGQLGDRPIVGKW